MVVPLRPGASLARPSAPFIETGRLKLRMWQESDIAPNTAMLADPASATLHHRRRQARHRRVCRVAQRRRHGRALGAARLRLFRGRGKKHRPFRRAGRAVVSAGLAGLRGRLGHRPRVSAARATRSRRRAQPSTGSFATFEIDRVIHCIDRENLPSQAVARRLGAVTEHEIDLFGHVRGPLGDLA